jgi:hypothetical protein
VVVHQFELRIFFAADAQINLRICGYFKTQRHDCKGNNSTDTLSKGHPSETFLKEIMQSFKSPHP